MTASGEGSVTEDALQRREPKCGSPRPPQAPCRPAGLAVEHSGAIALLAASAVAGLLLIPLGLPGLWVIVLGILSFGWLSDFRSLSAGFLALVVGLAGLGEVVEAWIGFRFAQRYGGSKRAGWGALVGGIIGAIIGVPIPIIGSVIGGFAGAFV